MGVMLLPLVGFLAHEHKLYTPACSAVLGCALFVTGGALMLLPYSGKALEEANIFSAWLFMAGSLGFLVCAVASCVADGMSKGNFFFAVGQLLYTAGTALLITDAHLSRSHPDVFYEPNPPPFAPAHYVVYGGWLQMAGAMGVAVYCIYRPVGHWDAVSVVMLLCELVFTLGIAFFLDYAYTRRALASDLEAKPLGSDLEAYRQDPSDRVGLQPEDSRYAPQGGMM